MRRSRPQTIFGAERSGRSPASIAVGRVALLLALVLVGPACSEQNGGDGDDTGTNQAPSDTSSESPEDGSDEDTDADTDVIDCEAGEIVRCSEENTQSIVKCQDDGSGTRPASCPPSEVCRSGECVKVNCIPGDGRCNGKTPEVCNEAGETYVEKEPCDDKSSCENGTCLDRCEIAAKTNSYVGCEYWAVELENHLLYEERGTGSSIPDDRLPPFAIVLANTSTSYDAKVTVLEDPDTPAKAIGSRTVGTDIPTQGEAATTVHSELVKANGTKLLKSIDKRLVDVPLPKNSLLTLILPNRQIPDGKSTVRKYAYRIKSTKPVVAYQFNPYCCNYNYTNDASLLLPVSALTGNYTYMSYSVWDAANRAEGDNPESATVSVVATKPDTDVTVQLPEPNKSGLKYLDMLYPIEGNRISKPDDQGQMTVTLQPHEVLNLAGDTPGVDLTGARITADKPVAAFGAHSCAYAPFTTPACDHLEQQLFPMETWGQRFIATPLKLRGPEDADTREATYWKFVARKPETRIETGLDLRTNPDGVFNAAGEGVAPCKEFSPNPSEGVIVLDKGETCEFGTQTTFVVEASQPIMVGAFLSGQNSVGENVSHAGDPAFFLVPPEAQYRTEYSFLTPETYFVNYVTVTIPTGFQTIKLDGDPVDLTQAESYEEFPNLGVARAHIEVDEGPHTISSDKVQFGIVAYGYDDYVSYAYTGGLNLTKRDDIERE